MSDDVPSKAEARGVRHRKRNPYANRLRDKQYRQRKVEDKKNGRKRDRGLSDFADSDDDIFNDV